MSWDATLQEQLLARAESLRRYVESKIPPNLQAAIAPEDVLQEVWIAAFSSFPGFNPTRPDALDRWLTAITNHKLIDSLKTAVRIKRGGGLKHVQVAQDYRTSLHGLFARVASSGRTPSRDVAVTEAAHAVQIALSRLPDTRRRVIQMRYLEGRSRAEIARSMDMSDAAVNSLLFNALRDLRRRLGEATRFFSDARSQGDTRE